MRPTYTHSPKTGIPQAQLTPPHDPGLRFSYCSDCPLVSGRSPEVSARAAALFRKGLNETGYVEDQNVKVEYHWLEGQYNRLPSVLADAIRRRVAVITTTAENAALAAKAATTTIPIIFSVGEDPVKLGLVTSLAHPGGNATGHNFLPVKLCPNG